MARHHSRYETTSRASGSASGLPYAVTIRNAHQAGSGRGRKGRCRHHRVPPAGARAPSADPTGPGGPVRPGPPHRSSPTTGASTPIGATGRAADSPCTFEVGEGPPGHRRRPHQRAGPSQAGGDDPRGAGEVESGAAVDLVLRGVEKKGSPNPSATEPATTASSRSSRFATRGHGPADQGPGAAPNPFIGLRPPGEPVDRLDGQTRSLGLETAPAAARAPPPFRLHHDMTDVAGVPVGTVEQPAVEHDAATHSCRHHHGQVVRDTPGRAQPALAQRQRLGVVVHRHRQVDQLRILRRSGNPRQAPMFRGDTDSPPEVIGPPQPTPHRDGADPDWDRASSTAAASAPKTASGSPVRGVGTVACGPTEPPGVDDCRRHLGPPDVDGQHHGTVLETGARRRTRPGRVLRVAVAHGGVSRRGGSVHGSSHEDRGRCCSGCGCGAIGRCRRYRPCPSAGRCWRTPPRTGT